MGMSRYSEQPSGIGARRALRSGVVVDGETLVQILRQPLERARIFGIVKPGVVACAPSDAVKEERQLLIDSTLRAGASSVTIIPEPLAAAVGAGMDVSSPYAQMIVDIGEGVTDCAIIRYSKIRATCAIRSGCEAMRRAIMLAAQESEGSSISEAEAGLLLRRCGLERSVDHLVSEHVSAAVQPEIEKTIDTIVSFLEGLPHDMGCEIIESGICLTGGGALIPGVREYLELRTGIRTTVANNPRACVVEGARAILPVILMLNKWK